MGKFTKEAFKWTSEMLMAMATSFLFLAISIATTSEPAASMLVIMVSSFVAFVILTMTSFALRMMSV